MQKVIFFFLSFTFLFFGCDKKDSPTENNNGSGNITVTLGTANVIYLENYSEVKKIEYSGTNISIEVSGSIYGEDVAGANFNDPIQLLIVGISNEQDGSAFVSKTFNGTHNWNANPQSWSFTSNSATNKILCVAITTSVNDVANLKGSYNININGTNHTIDATNVIYLENYSEVKKIEYSSTNISIEVSSSIYGEDVAGANFNDPIQLLIVGISNEQDGSAFVSKTFNGTHNWNANPQSWSFTSNSATNKILCVAVTTSVNDVANLKGQYSVTVKN